MPETGLCSKMETGVPRRHILVMCCLERRGEEHWDPLARTKSIGRVKETKARGNDAVGSRSQFEYARNKGATRTEIESRLKMCVRRWSSDVANHWPSGLMVIRSTLGMVSAIGFLSSSLLLSLSGCSEDHWLWISSSTSPISTSSPPLEACSPFVNVPFGCFCCLRDLTTRFPTTVSFNLWCSKRLSNRGLSEPRSKMRIYDVWAVERTNFDESGEKQSATAPVLVSEARLGILERTKAGNSLTRFTETCPSA